MGNAIQSGSVCPKEISLILEGFFNYRLLDTTSIKSGDKVLCKIIPFDNLTVEEREIQISDDLQLYLLDDYYCIDIQLIEEFSDNESMPSSGIFFSDGNREYISVFDRHINPPISSQNRDEQNAQCKGDASRMNAYIEKYDTAKRKEINEKFNEAWENNQKKDAPGYNRVRNGNIVWRNIDDSFWCLPKKYTLLPSPKTLKSNTLDCFLSLKKALEQNGVQLIVSLVPDQYVIAARVINPEFRDVPDIQTAAYVKQLSEAGIETIYASDAIIRNYNRYPFAFFYPDNGHPSDTAQDVISDIIAERLKRYNIPSSLNKDLFSEIQSPNFYYYHDEFNFPSDCDISNNEANKPYTCRNILYEGQVVRKIKEASLFIVGNSYIVSPMRLSTADSDSLPSLVSQKILSPVDWLFCPYLGVFQEALNQLINSPESFLQNKKVLIFACGTDNLSVVDEQGQMFNISTADHERILLNNKKIVTQFQPTSNNYDNKASDNQYFEELKDKNVFIIGKEKELTIATLQLDDNSSISHEKPFVFVVQATSVKDPCYVFVNDTKKMIPVVQPEHARYYNLTFEFPAGTNDITVKIQGIPGAFLAIKDIQIWQ